MAKVILYVEDDENSVFFFKEAMKRAGSDYLMHVASDGQMAIDYLGGRGFTGIGRPIRCRAWCCWI